MATRVPKTGASGGHEFTQGSQPLHVSELDGDLDALFDNGITDANVAPGAGIATAKLASDQGIITAMLASNAVTTAKIADLNVTTGKLAVGAAVSTGTSAAFTAGLQLSGIGDVTYVTLPALTTRGARVVVMGTLAGMISVPAGDSITAKLKRNGTAIALWTVNAGTGATAVNVPSTVPILAVDLPAAGTYTYTVTLNASTVNSIFLSNAVNPGALFALELA